MKILEVKSLAIPDIKLVRFGRFPDERGFFTETFRRSDITPDNSLEFLDGQEFVQFNESFSQAGVVRWMDSEGRPVIVLESDRETGVTIIWLLSDVAKGAA